MIKLIETKEDLIVNINTFNSYRTSASENEREFYTDRLQKGKNFVVYQKNNGALSFTPSKFVGYKDNDCYSHYKTEKHTIIKRPKAPFDKINKWYKVKTHTEGFPIINAYRIEIEDGNGIFVMPLVNEKLLRRMKKRLLNNEKNSALYRSVAAQLRKDGRTTTHKITDILDARLYTKENDAEKFNMYEKAYRADCKKLSISIHEFSRKYWVIGEKKKTTKSSKKLANRRGAAPSSDKIYRRQYLRNYEIEIHPNHKNLQESFGNYLIRNSLKIKHDENRVDIRYTDADRHLVIAEIKPITDRHDVLFAVRYAIGQLLEYRHFEYPDAHRLLVVIGCKPDLEIIEFIHSLDMEIAWPTSAGWKTRSKVRFKFSRD